MQKEIFEQPVVVAQTLQLLSAAARGAGRAARDASSTSARSSASRSSPAAPLTTPAWSPNTGSSASRACRSRSMSPREFRYREPVLEPGGARAVHLAVGRDRRHAGGAAPLQGRRASTIAVVVNVPTSSMAREADLLLPTHAGPEIGVASTKAFTCQLAVLAALAANLARARARSTRDEEREIVQPPARGARRAQRRARAMTRRSRRWRT